MCWHSTRCVVSCRPASKDNISAWVLCNSKASPCFMFVLPGSLVCLLSSQSVALAELPPRLICSRRDSEPSVDLNGQPTEGFFHKIVFYWCYTLTSAEVCIPELPPLLCSVSAYLTWQKGHSFCHLRGFCGELCLLWCQHREVFSCQVGGSAFLSIPIGKGPPLHRNFTLSETQQAQYL